MSPQAAFCAYPSGGSKPKHLRLAFDGPTFRSSIARETSCNDQPNELRKLRRRDGADRIAPILFLPPLRFVSFPGARGGRYPRCGALSGGAAMSRLQGTAGTGAPGRCPSRALLRDVPGSADAASHLRRRRHATPSVGVEPARGAEAHRSALVGARARVPVVPHAAHDSSVLRAWQRDHRQLRELRHHLAGLLGAEADR